MGRTENWAKEQVMLLQNCNLLLFFLLQSVAFGIKQRGKILSGFPGPLNAVLTWKLLQK